MRPMLGTLLAALMTLIGGCFHNRIAEVYISQTSSEFSSDAQVPSRVALILPRSFESFVFEHHASDWLATYRIHAGEYVSEMLLAFCKERFKTVWKVESFSEAPKEWDLIVLPVFQQFDYATPTIHAYQDAQFTSRMQLTVLDSVGRTRDVLVAQGVSTGTFGRGGRNTKEIARDALDKMLRKVYSSLNRLTPSSPVSLRSPGFNPLLRRGDGESRGELQKDTGRLTH